MLRRVLTPLCGLWLAWSGCTSATFDAVCEDWNGVDPLPPGARSLEGRYVMQVDSFSLQSFGALLDLAAKEHVQATFVTRIYEQQGRLRMELHGCTWQTESEAFGEAFTTFAQLGSEEGVAAMPSRVFTLQLGPGCTWSARPDEPSAWGYTVTTPADCTRPGQRIKASREQVWLDGLCVCPAEDAGVPTDESDCRVTDPDHDGDPGFTISEKGEEFGHMDRFFVLRNLNEFVDGVVDDEGYHVAYERYRETRVSMGCEKVSEGTFLRRIASSFLTACEDLPDRMPCPDASSRVVLRPIQAEMSDAQACQLARVAFWGFQPSFPADCIYEAPGP